MKHRVLILCIAVSCICGAFHHIAAQTAPTQATEDDVFHWLRSGDPRMVAWGAYFSAKDQRQNMVPELAQLAQAWRPLPRQEYDTQGNYIPRTAEQVTQIDEMQAVLDALIQMHGTVSPEAIGVLTEDFTPQALTLFAHLPNSERTGLAKGIYATRRGAGSKYDWRQFAHDQMVHLAAAILAQNPPSGFTATLINEATVTVKVSVTDQAKPSDEAFGLSGCGDSLGMTAPAGWPQPWTYVVEQHWESERMDGLTVLVSGEPSITSRQAYSSSSCSTLDWLSSSAKLNLVKQEAGNSAKKLGIGPMGWDNLAYSGPSAYSAAIKAIAAKHTQPFHKLAAELLTKGLMTPDEAATALPEIRIQINDERQSKAEALPSIDSQSSKVVFEEWNSEAWFSIPRLD